MNVHKSSNMPTRDTAMIAAADLLAKFIKDRGLSRRAFAEAAGIAESTLRHFLNYTCHTTAARRHARRPYGRTLRPILSFNIPIELREAMTLAIDYEEHVLATLRGSTDRAKCAGNDSKIFASTAG